MYTHRGTDLMLLALYSNLLLSPKPLLFVFAQACRIEKTERKTIPVEMLVCTSSVESFLHGEVRVKAVSVSPVRALRMSTSITVTLELYFPLGLIRIVAYTCANVFPRLR